MTTSLFPDVNVWLALAHEIHPHHIPATSWEQRLNANATLCFCRFTQLGLLRLLTNRSVMGGDVLTQSDAWRAYDSFLASRDIQLLQEPDGLDETFRRLTSRKEASTKQWADAYLIVFAMTFPLSLVTFDRALAKSAKASVLIT